MSVYPAWFTPANDWATCNTQVLANMNDMVARYGSEVMIVECGMSWDSPTACKSFLTDIIAKTKGIASSRGLGVFYWEPQSYGQWQGYTLGAFDNSGKPTVAMDAFNNLTGVENTKAELVELESQLSINQSLVTKLGPKPTPSYKTEAEAIRHSGDVSKFILN